MATYRPANGEKHQSFLAWCRTQSVTFNKITPAHFVNAGLGIASTDAIEGPRRAKKGENKNPMGLFEGETIAFTPKAALLTRENLKQFSPTLGDFDVLLKELSTHAVFAAAISKEKRNKKNLWAPWMRVWPSLKEFAEGVPLLWTEEQQELLPPSTISILEAQKKNFERDFEKVNVLGFGFSRDEYIHSWLVVNTRSLFYKLDTKDYKELSKEDCMALCPFIDYFNHSDDGCKVELSPTGYTVTSSKDSLPANTQLFVTYGCHSNDFLLCEYGFILHPQPNKWDEVNIDTYILSDLTPDQKRHLDAEGFLGNYIFDRSTFCFRTQAAVRMMLIKNPGSPRSSAKVDRWRRYLIGQEDGERERVVVEEYLGDLLEKLRMREREVSERVDDLAEGSVKRLLSTRWEQVLKIVESVEANTKSEEREGGVGGGGGGRGNPGEYTM